MAEGLEAWGGCGAAADEDGDEVTLLVMDTVAVALLDAVELGVGVTDEDGVPVGELDIVAVVVAVAELVAVGL